MPKKNALSVKWVQGTSSNLRFKDVTNILEEKVSKSSERVCGVLTIQSFES